MSQDALQKPDKPRVTGTRKNPHLTARNLEQNPAHGETHLPKASQPETEERYVLLLVVLVVEVKGYQTESTNVMFPMEIRLLEII